MHRGLALLALLALAPSLAGCSRRDRANPFDPGNPATGGRPVGFASVAGDGVVALRWQPASGLGLEGFQVYRRSAGQPDYRAITSVLRASVTTFVDSDVLNGLEYSYRLYFVFFDDREGTPAETVATPGPLKVWVAEAGGHRLTRIAPDGRQVVTSDAAFSSPSHVAVDHRIGFVWVADALASEVVVLQPATGGRLELEGVTGPGAIALDPVRGDAWVCDPPAGVVHHFGADGARLTPMLGPLDDPLSAAVDPSDGAVWVCDNRGHQVRKFSRAGVSLVSWTTGRPSRVAVDSLTRDAWVTSLDQGRVFRLDVTGAPLDTITFATGPVGVAVDHRRGHVWIADPVVGQVFVLDRDGDVFAHAPALPGVTEVDVDLATGEAWLTSPATGEVVRMSRNGTVVRKLGGLAEPYGIALSGTR